MSILKKLRERQAQQLTRSIQGTELFEKRVEKKAEYVKELLLGDNPNAGVPVEVVAFRDLYVSFLEKYTGEKAYKFTGKMSHQSVSLWTRAESARKRANVSQERFIKAQFVWFTKVFGTYPKPVQLTTEGAVDRAREFSGDTKGKVAPIAVAHKTSLPVLFRENEKLLQKMMKAQNCSREEFYIRFVLTGVYSLSKEFLEADPVYQRVRGQHGK